jgi:glycosyltransferase involved in cell wall biosynthesis
MACGIPVVNTETAGTLETITHGETGWLVNQDSDADVGITARTLSVLDRDGDAMSVAARSRAVASFSDHVTLSRFLAVYTQLLGNVPGRPPFKQRESNVG